MGINTTQEFSDYLSGTSGVTSGSVTSSFVPEILAVYPNECAYYIPPSPELPCNATYPPSYGAQYRRTSAYVGDFAFIANRRGTCETWAANDLPAYCYRFNTLPTGIPWASGVTHYQEVAFVFDNVDGLGYDGRGVNPFANKSSAFMDLAKLMSNSWVSFIYDGNPNNFTGRCAGAHEWRDV